MGEKPVLPLVAIKTVAGYIAQKAIRKCVLVKYRTGVRNVQTQFPPFVEQPEFVELSVEKPSMMGTKVPHNRKMPEVASEKKIAAENAHSSGRRRGGAAEMGSW